MEVAVLGYLAPTALVYPRTPPLRNFSNLTLQRREAMMLRTCASVLGFK